MLSPKLGIMKRSVENKSTARDEVRRLHPPTAILVESDREPVMVTGFSWCCDPGQWIQLSYDDQTAILARLQCPAKQSIEPMALICTQMFQLILAM
jgi:hypothetical protein